MNEWMYNVPMKQKIRKVRKYLICANLWTANRELERKKKQMNEYTNKKVNK